MGRGKWSLEFLFVYGITAILALVILLPFFVVIAGAFVPAAALGISSEQWVGGTDGLLTFRWFGYVWDIYQPSLLFSFKLAILSVVICIGIGVPGGTILARSNFPGRRLVEQLVLLPLSLPGIAMSIALIRAYVMIRGRWELILMGHLLYTLPFMVRTVTNTLRSFNVNELDAAAQSLGAGFWYRFFHVIVPNLKHPIILGSLLVFAISWGEFNVSFLLNTPLHQTYPAALYATYTSNSFQVSSAATTIFLAVITPVLFLIQWLGGKEGVTVEQGA